ncbi:surfeit locus protein 6 homolog isoform X2 [Toxorhynchites rutilus septentrionalis]|uniref:surfeit locus protein 6 homolog isoform X2 n=1 Tax=Toxorhynchites rutilus septentrionalis TaxID=329112 RepID=UPI002479D6D7|nr:surfeit locus protein 6 homolog isoform X2 [Toxorhynchites rutilus septentrionalis]
MLSDYLIDDGTRKAISTENTNNSENSNDRLEVMQNKKKTKHVYKKREKSHHGKKDKRKTFENGNATRLILKTELNEKKKIATQDKISATKLFNANEKIVFSRIQFDENDVVRKNTETDVTKLVRKTLDEKKELENLKLSGNIDEYIQKKNDKAWDRATSKTMGQKVRDDVGLLAKKIQKRKKQVAKSKQQWLERKQKVEHKKAARQKKRTENIKERADKKKNKKMQKLAKHGRIIPGF